jgi:hypothetical protein
MPFGIDDCVQPCALQGEVGPMKRILRCGDGATENPFGAVFTCGHIRMPPADSEIAMPCDAIVKSDGGLVCR